MFNLIRHEPGIAAGIALVILLILATLYGLYVLATLPDYPVVQAKSITIGDTTYTDVQIIVFDGDSFLIVDSK